LKRVNIPFDFANDLAEDYLKAIQYVCLIFSECYIRAHFSEIVENVIEHRVYDSELSIEEVVTENRHNLTAWTRIYFD
jgi:hypothetical protein